MCPILHHSTCVVEIHCNLLGKVPTSGGPFNFLFFALVPGIAQNQNLYKTLESLNRTVLITYGLEYS